MARISSIRARPVSGRSIRTMIRVLRISASTPLTKTTSRSLTARSPVTFRPTDRDDRNVGYYQYKKTAQSECGYRKLCAVSFVVRNCDVLQDVAHDISSIDAVSNAAQKWPMNVISRGHHENHMMEIKLGGTRVKRYIHRTVEQVRENVNECNISGKHVRIQR